MPVVRTVSVGRPHDAAWIDGEATSIEKLPVDGPVVVGPLGLAGDEVSDTIHHGGPDQALYVFAREDLDHWVEVLGHPIRDGQFGENLTTSGIDVNEARDRRALAGRHRTVRGRIACARPATSSRVGWAPRVSTTRQWVKRFAAEGRPGPYLRVLEPGRVAAGDELSGRTPSRARRDRHH